MLAPPCSAETRSAIELDTTITRKTHEMLASLAWHLDSLDDGHSVEEVSSSLFVTLVRRTRRMIEERVSGGKGDEQCSEADRVSMELIESLGKLFTPSTGRRPLGILPREVETHSMSRVMGRTS